MIVPRKFHLDKAKRRCKCGFCGKYIIKGQKRMFHYPTLSNYSKYFHLNCYLRQLEKDNMIYFLDIQRNKDIIKQFKKQKKKELEKELKLLVIQEL